MPFDPADTFLSADFLEFVAVFVVMVITMAIMVVLGNWWAR